MTGRACKAAICCSAVAAKIDKIDELIGAKFIKDERLLDEIIRSGEEMDERLKDLIQKIRDSG